MKPGKSERKIVAGKPLYVEIPIDAPLARVWELSQNTEQHPRWDLRFTRIVPELEDERGNTHFRYEFQLPFYTVRGTGVSLGHKHRSDGQATSVLKFDTQDVISPIGKGAGYWRYIPTETGIRFITGYNYQPGLGLIGKVFDAKLIRPALGWATALSFDRLRLWAESDLTPETSMRRWILDASGRGGLLVTAAALLYSGQQNKRMSTFAAAGVALTTAFVVKAHRSVPRAKRCLRVPPHESDARAPSALQDLADPKNEQSKNKSRRSNCAVNF